MFTQIPIYATTPVISLGRTLLQDIYSSTPLASTTIPKSYLSESSYSYSSLSDAVSTQYLLQPPTTEEIASYFSLINPLKYSQPHQPLPSPFSPPLNGLTITAYNAGHTLGGTIWHLQHEVESVVYAVDWNQVRENVLSGAAWLGGAGAGGAEVIEQLRKPTALVCSSKGAERNPLAGGRAKRDALLLDMIRTSVAKGGTVLIPTDTSARVLELAYLLEHAWRKEADSQGDKNLQSAKLYLASRNVGATMRYARSMLEWMDENVVREFEAEANTTADRQNKRTDSKVAVQEVNRPTGKSGGPFDFKYVKLLERKSQVNRILANQTPQVILASDTSLEWGFSREVLRRIADGPSNLVILTADPGVGAGSIAEDNKSLGRTFWDWYQERRDGVAMETTSDGQPLEQVHTGGRELQIHDVLRAPLEGKELLVYQQYLATQRQLQNTLQNTGDTNLETSADAIDEASSTNSSSSDESDPERQGKALNISATLAHSNRNKLGANKETVGVNVLLRQPGVYDYDVRNKKGRESLFPYVTKRRRADDFGELIRPEDYLRAEERDEINGQDMRDAESGKQSRLGQKRKWEDARLRNANGRRVSNGNIKRRRTGQMSNIDPSANGVNSGHDAQGHDTTGDELSDDSSSESEELSDGPAKLVYKSSTVQVNLRIAFVDFAGLHDQRSLSMLIPLIQPRKLILIGGSKSETAWLANDCRQKLRSKSGTMNGGTMDDIFSPGIDEVVSASMDTNAWTVKLSEGLVKRLHWQNVRGLSVVTLLGRLAATAADEQPQTEALRKKRQKMLKDEPEASDLENLSLVSDKAPRLIPTLDTLPPSMTAATRSVAQPLHVGDLRLADLRKMLQSIGHIAEFRGEGTLLIDDLVAVRKSGTGQIEVEGGGLRNPELRPREYEASFYAVKRRIYEGLAIIAGG